MLMLKSPRRSDFLAIGVSAGNGSTGIGVRGDNNSALMVGGVLCFRLFSDGLEHVFSQVPRNRSSKGLTASKVT